MPDTQPCGSSDMVGDSSDDKLSSLCCASPSEDDDPEDQDELGGKKKKKKKSPRKDGQRSREAKAIATYKTEVSLPESNGNDPSEFAESFGRVLRMTSQTHVSVSVKCALLLQCCKTKYLEKQVN